MTNLLGTDLHWPEGCMAGIAMHDKSVAGTDLHLPEGCMAGIAMHELSLLENVREILESHALSQNFSKVTQVTLEIGKLSCVEPDALALRFRCGDERFAGRWRRTDN